MRVIATLTLAVMPMAALMGCDLGCPDHGLCTPKPASTTYLNVPHAVFPTIGEPRLVGTWLLKRTRVVHLATGQVRPDPVRGPNPRGILTIDAWGNFSNQLVNGDRSTAEVEAKLKSASGEDAVSRALGYGAYYGRASVDPKNRTLTISVVDGHYPTLRGQVLTRRYLLEEDSLRLWFERAGVDGQRVHVELDWVKAVGRP